MTEPETIIAVAVWHRDIVYSLKPPARHHDVIHMMAQAGHGPKAMKHQGFVTSWERFVDRREALQIARAAGQIKAKTPPEDQLFSEDMW